MTVAAYSWNGRRFARFGLKFTLVGVMKLLLWWALVIAGVLAGPDNPLENDYRLGTGDAIKISVNDEPDMALEIKVPYHGKISYYFLGDVQVAGLTVRELENSLTKLLLDGFLLKPVVTVAVVTYRKYFINGEVTTTKGYDYKPGLTVRRAVVEAGGFTENADKERITVIRGNDPLYKEIPIDLDDPIYPGDILTVQESFW